MTDVYQQIWAENKQAIRDEIDNMRTQADLVINILESELENIEAIERSHGIETL